MKLKREHIVALGIILLIVVLAGMYTFWVRQTRLAEETPARHALTVGDGVSPYTDLSGNVISLLDEIDSVLVVTVWASWSPGSSVELQNLAKLSETYGSKVSVIAINRAEPASTAERFLKTIGVSEQVTLVLDPDDNYYNSIGGYAMPETIVYNTKGEIVHHHRGTITYQELLAYTDQALEQDIK